VKALKREISGIKVIEQNRNSVQKSHDKLEKQWEKSEAKRQDVEAKLKLCIFCLRLLAPIRLRWMLSPLESTNNGAEMEAGNKAAHDSNLLVDIALFALGILDEKYRIFFRQIYDFSIEEFVKSPAALQPLMDAPKVVALVNMRGSMAGYFAFSKKSLCVDSTVDDFLALEARCKEVLAEAYVDHTSKNVAREAYAADTETSETQMKMKSLVLVMARLHKNRHKATNAEHAEDNSGRRHSK
jgi:hypothetical protein